MSDMYNWNNDDFQNQPEETNEEKYFTYNETYLATRKQKNKNKKTLKFIALLLAAAVFGSAVTTGVMYTFLPEYINDQVAKASVINNTSKNNNEILHTALNDNTKTGDNLSVVSIAKKVGPAVVGIVSTIPTQSYFGIMESQGSGSGIIISQNGYVVTNNHVIEGANKIVIYLSSGETKEATVVGTDARTDLAVLKMESGQYPYATLGQSSDLEVGELCVAIGNPLGMEFAGSVTVGYISALNRTVQADGKTFNLIQTDAAINAGNSGGALVNTKGQVIGINTLKISSTGVEGLGFAIPIDEAKPIIEDLMNHGYVKGRPVIGISGRDLSADMARYYGYPEGIFVEQAMPGSGAAKAGIKRGDIITKADGTRIKTIEELNKIRDKKKAGQTIKLELDRSGQIISVDVVLGEENAK